MRSIEIRPVWVANGPDNPYEFSFTHGADRFDALRHRTEWGWAWWEIFKNGKFFRSGGDLFAILIFSPSDPVVSA